MQFLLKRLTCEFLGSMFLLATVVGSGILAEKLAQGNIAIVVLSIAFATGGVLSALILAFSGISSQFNPLVTFMTALKRELEWSSVLPYIVAQIGGAISGVILANLMFDLPAVTISDHARTGAGQWLGEFVATFGLFGIILGTGRFRPETTPWAVGAYVAGAIWFTSSTCFANPAVTIARTITGTITGIRTVDTIGFIASQAAATIVAFILFEWLFAQSQVPEKTVKQKSREKELAGIRR